MVSALRQKAAEMDQQSAGAAEELWGMLRDNKVELEVELLFIFLNLSFRAAWGHTTKHTQRQTRTNTSSPSWPKPRGSLRTNLMDGPPSHHRRCCLLAWRPCPTLISADLKRVLAWKVCGGGKQCVTSVEPQIPINVNIKYISAYLMHTHTKIGQIGSWVT